MQAAAVKRRLATLCMNEKRHNIRTGCCGFALPQAKYFATFPCIEIDTSFYQLPKIETAARWRASAPAGFEFAMKAWQVITHPASSPTYKRTRLSEGDRKYCGHFGFNPTVRWAWDQTLAVAKTLRAVCVLFQCPASFRPTKENIAGLRRFFERAKRGKFHMGWEPRGEWPAELISGLCNDLELIHVVDPLKAAPACAGKIRYYRLHGTTGFRHRYTQEELRQLRELCSGRAPTYCMFNNITMADDAQRFARLL
jgi:uncharacterized protein YecE (DUF72 family)